MFQWGKYMFKGDAQTWTPPDISSYSSWIVWKEKHITPSLGLNSRLQLDCTSWSPQWYHQYPSSSLLYCSFTWQCSCLSNNGAGSSWNWQRASQHTQREPYYFPFSSFLFLKTQFIYRFCPFLFCLYFFTSTSFLSRCCAISSLSIFTLPSVPSYLPLLSSPG